MRCMVISFIIATIINGRAQNNSTFSELKGLDDKQGQTYLFFRFNYRTSTASYHNIYKLLGNNNNISVFLYDYSPFNHYQSGIEVYSYDFWKNDPDKYIYSGASGLLYFGTTDGFINRFQGTIQAPVSSSVSNLLISQIDGNKVYCLTSPQYQEYFSTDSGFTWTQTSFSGSIEWINQRNGELYSIRSESLTKSSDQGSIFVTSDNQFVNTYQFSNDADSTHIYRIAWTSQPLKYHLVISNSNGNYGSWVSKYSSSNEICYSVDASQSGHIFLADGKRILYSEDFGYSFNLFYTMSSSIIGIYKKPLTNVLYTMDSNHLFKFIDTIPGTILTTDIVGIDENIEQTNGFGLSQNYPNPFNPSTIISYHVPVNGDIVLKVYDLLGREIATLVDEYKNAGKYNVEFRDQNSKLSSGIYFYQLKTGEFVETKKMILMK